ncbi:MAG TPA: protein-glutamate O-methyltransferase CheR [Longimicrobiales bacterium]
MSEVDGAASRQGVATLLRRYAGLDPARFWSRGLDAAVAEEMRRCGAERPEVYLRRLKGDVAALESLVERVVIRETYVYREPEQLDFVTELLAGRQTGDSPNEGPVRLWSAGCASGEEAYSLAIAAARAGFHRRARVLGTDISGAALERARRAEYGPWSLREPEASKVRAFFEAGRGRCRPRPQIRAMVRFRRLNLVDDRWSAPDLVPGGMDVILCRNVLLYFAAEHLERVARRFALYLVDGGWLLTGGADPALPRIAGLEPVRMPWGVAYRRRATRGARTRSAAAAASPCGDPGPSSDRAPAGGAASSGAAAAPSGSAAGAAAGGRDADPLPAIQARLRAGDTATARSLCAEAVARTPMSAPLHCLHAMLLLDGGDIEGARAAARRALYVDRTLAVAHLAHGEALLRAGAAGAAAPAFRAAERLLSGQPSDGRPDLGGGATTGQLLALVRARLAQLAARRG